MGFYVDNALRLMIFMSWGSKRAVHIDVLKREEEGWDSGKWDVVEMFVKH